MEKKQKTPDQIINDAYRVTPYRPDNWMSKSQVAALKIYLHYDWTCPDVIGVHARNYPISTDWETIIYNSLKDPDFALIFAYICIAKKYKR